MLAQEQVELLQRHARVLDRREVEAGEELAGGLDEQAPALDRQSQEDTNTVIHAEESASVDPGRFDFRNCIVWGNDSLTPPQGGVLVFTDGLGGTLGNSAVSHAIVEPDQSYWDCDFQDQCDNSLGCTNFACDPSFLGSSFHLGSGSVAIDKGVSAPAGTVLLPDVFDFDDDGNTTEDVPWDLDGDTRVQGLEIDRGCYEDS